MLREALEHQRPFTKREAKVNSLSGHQFTVDYSVNPMLAAGGKAAAAGIASPETAGCVFPGKKSCSASMKHRLIWCAGWPMKSRIHWVVCVALPSCCSGSWPIRGLHDYTQVIISEADRLRDLVDRLLGPYRRPQLASVNIHAVFLNMLPVCLKQRQQAQ